MKNFNFFLGGWHLFVDFFFHFKENTLWHLKGPIQTASRSNNNKALVNISSISNSESPLQNVSSFVWRIVANEYV